MNRHQRFKNGLLQFCKDRGHSWEISGYLKLMKTELDKTETGENGQKKLSKRHRMLPQFYFSCIPQLLLKQIIIKMRTESIGRLLQTCSEMESYVRNCFSNNIIPTNLAVRIVQNENGEYSIIMVRKSIFNRRLFTSSMRCYKGLYEKAQQLEKRTTFSNIKGFKFDFITLVSYLELIFFVQEEDILRTNTNSHIIGYDILFSRKLHCKTLIIEGNNDLISFMMLNIHFDELVMRFQEWPIYSLKYPSVRNKILSLKSKTHHNWSFFDMPRDVRGLRLVNRRKNLAGSLIEFLEYICTTDDYPNLEELAFFHSLSRTAPVELTPYTIWSPGGDPYLKELYREGYRVFFLPNMNLVIKTFHLQLLAHYRWQKVQPDWFRKRVTRKFDKTVRANLEKYGFSDEEITSILKPPQKKRSLDDISCYWEHYALYELLIK